MKIRLSKILAKAGIASRRAAEKLIFEGRVTVDKKPVLKPEEHFALEEHEIRVDGTLIKAFEKKVTYILHKPSGYLCTSRRPRNENIFLDLFPKSEERLFTIGRLDKETDGLLLVTNDGDFAQKVIHPRSNIEKEYLVKAKVMISHEHLITLSKGIYIEGKKVRPIRVKKIRKNTLSITVKEGKKHEIRLLAEAADLPIHSLTRIRIGGLRLGTLERGSFRSLTEKDEKALFSH